MKPEAARALELTDRKSLLRVLALDPYLSARRAKPGCSRIAFEVILHIEGTTKKYQTLILDIGPGDTPEPVITIGFPADF